MEISSFADYDKIEIEVLSSKYFLSTESNKFLSNSTVYEREIPN